MVIFIVACECHIQNRVEKERLSYSIYSSIQVHLNKLECRGKVNLFQ